MGEIDFWSLLQKIIVYLTVKLTWFRSHDMDHMNWFTSNKSLTAISNFVDDRYNLNNQRLPDVPWILMTYSSRVTLMLRTNWKPFLYCERMRVSCFVSIEIEDCQLIDNDLKKYETWMNAGIHANKQLLYDIELQSYLPLLTCSRLTYWIFYHSLRVQIHKFI